MSSPSPIQKVIIIGAGGHLGPHLVSAFDTDPHFQLSILSRASSDHSHFPSHIPVYSVGDNYNASEPELVEIFRGQDAIISSIAAHAVLQQKTIINAALKAGVKYFVPSEFGHDTRNEQAARLLPPFLVTQKRQIVEYLQSKELDGLKWMAFVTGPFFEVAVPNFLGFDFLSRHATILNSYGDHRWSTTTLSTTALAVKNALLTPDKTTNKYLFVESFNISQMDILTALRTLTGGWDVSYHNAEEEKRQALEKLSQGNYSGLPTLMRYITCVEGYGGDYMTYEESANGLLSLPKERLEDALGKMVKQN
ncbi:hypothetical protein N7535_006856 [Penicillium sp. DV-2018c]|nr:hypothetical protein N7461_007062 [Penicillium sp. DV-2018c]KAJ5567550.1 hypothetical protein N7535_006856 [Penicillium sp. DV-2018c]